MSKTATSALVTVERAFDSIQMPAAGPCAAASISCPAPEAEPAPNRPIGPRASSVKPRAPEQAANGLLPGSPVRSSGEAGRRVPREQEAIEADACELGRD